MLMSILHTRVTRGKHLKRTRRSNSLFQDRKFCIHIYVTRHEFVTRHVTNSLRTKQLSSAPSRPIPSTLAHFNHSQKINKYKYVTICQHYCTADRWASPRGNCVLKGWGLLSLSQILEVCKVFQPKFAFKYIHTPDIFFLTQSCSAVLLQLKT